jgi:CRP-like cAMP-binding protein
MDREKPAVLSFIKTLNSVVEFSPDQIRQVLSISKIKKINKDDCFILEGEKPRSFAYVYRGLFRYYYIDKKGKDFTKGFFLENSIIASYSALIQSRESYFSIEALEDAEIIETDYEKWKTLFNEKLVWHKFLLALIEKGYCIKEAREREFLLFSAEERYKSFLQTYPGLDKRIKQHIIASYLGITPVALSRIRNKLETLT